MLMVFKEIVAVYSENHKKPIYKYNMQSYWLFKQVVQIGTTGL
jgi:hypothetical protein